jgi:hypothetical protein
MHEPLSGRNDPEARSGRPGAGLGPGAPSRTPGGDRHLRRAARRAGPGRRPPGQRPGPPETGQRLAHRQRTAADSRGGVVSLGDTALYTARSGRSRPGRAPGHLLRMPRPAPLRRQALGSEGGGDLPEAGPLALLFDDSGPPPETARRPRPPSRKSAPNGLLGQVPEPLSCLSLCLARPSTRQADGDKDWPLPDSEDGSYGLGRLK